MTFPRHQAKIVETAEESLIFLKLGQNLTCIYAIYWNIQTLSGNLDADFYRAEVVILSAIFLAQYTEFIYTKFPVNNTYFRKKYPDKMECW